MRFQLGEFIGDRIDGRVAEAAIDMTFFFTFKNADTLVNAFKFQDVILNLLIIPPSTETKEIKLRIFQAWIEAVESTSAIWWT